MKKKKNEEIDLRECGACDLPGDYMCAGMPQGLPDEDREEKKG